MQFLWSKLRAVLPLIAGITALFGLPYLAPLVQFEHRLFVYPERFKADTVFPDVGNPADFSITPTSFQGSDESHSISSYLLDDETRDILGSQELTPTQWAYFLNHIRKGEEGLIVIADSLSWIDAEEIPLRVLEHEIAQTPNLVIGLQAELSGMAAPLPPYLESSVITRFSDSTLKLPTIDQIIRPPSISASLFGISFIKGPQPDHEPGELKVPMLVRWGDNLLPTTHLASLISALQLKPSDVIIDPKGYLLLGESGCILKIDEEGRAVFQEAQKSSQSASLILTKPDLVSASKILLSSGSSKFDSLLATHIPHVLARKTEPIKTYQRWPVSIEISLIILLALILRTRKWRIALLTVIAMLAGSVALSHWVLFLPIATLASTSAIFRKKAAKTATSTHLKPQEDQEKEKDEKSADHRPTSVVIPAPIAAISAPLSDSQDSDLEATASEGAPSDTLPKVSGEVLQEALEIENASSNQKTEIPIKIEEEHLEPAEKAPVEETPVAEAPAEEPPAEEPPAEEPPVEEPPAEEPPAEEPPVVEPPAEEPPLEEPPAEEPPVEEPPVEEPSAEEPPAEEPPVEEPPVEKTAAPSKKAATRKASGNSKTASKTMKRAAKKAANNKATRLAKKKARQRRKKRKK